MLILIVEDEYLIADMLSSMLKRNGYSEIVHADSIRKATEVLENEPDVCFLDIRLKQENGIEFAKILHQKNIPFVFITANNEIETIKEAALTNPQAYLTKPVHERDLIAALEIISSKFSKWFWIKTSMGKSKIKQNTILYIEADNVYCKIVCETKTYVERITLKEIESLLEPYFLRVHRSFIVNGNRIEALKGNELKISSHKIPTTKKYLELIEADPKLSHFIS